MDIYQETLVAAHKLLKTMLKAGCCVAAQSPAEVYAEDILIDVDTGSRSSVLSYYFTFATVC